MRTCAESSIYIHIYIYIYTSCNKHICRVTYGLRPTTNLIASVHLWLFKTARVAARYSFWFILWDVRHTVVMVFSCTSRICANLVEIGKKNSVSLKKRNNFKKINNKCCAWFQNELLHRMRSFLNRSRYDECFPAQHKKKWKTAGNV